MKFLARLLICACCLPLALCCPLAGAPDAAAPAAAAGSPEAPEVKRLAVLAHSPILDGVIEEDQWTAVETISAGDSAAGDPAAALHAAWDSSRLYLAVDAPLAASVVFYLDAKADGWLEGADNYEVAVVSGGAAPTVTVRLHNALLSAPAPVILDVKAAVNSTESRTVVELEIPASATKGLAFANGTAMAVGAGISPASGPANAAPGDPRSGLTAIVLSDELDTAAVEGLKFDIRIKDRKLVAGQTLSLDLFADNTAAEPLTYSNFTIGGEPRVADLLNFLRVRGGTLGPGKGIKWGFSTDLPETMPLGVFAVVGEMNLDDGRKATAVSSFEVIEPLEATLDAGSGPLARGAERTIVVAIRNHCPGPINGTVRLSLPAGLAPGLKRDTQKFAVRLENEVKRVEFKLRRPEASADGECAISAEVQMGSYTRVLDGAVLLGPPN